MTVHFGLNITRVHPHELAPIAQRAEALGFESLWLAEHVIIPYEPIERPGRPARPSPFPADFRFFEPVTTLVHLAAHTSTIRLGTGVMLLPLHSPFHVARSVATADVLSGGRINLGVGVGYLGDEFDIIGAGWSDRGARTDEAIAVLSGLWAEDVFEYHGTFFDFPPVGFEPKPVQRPRPTLHVGGSSPAALRRAARFGDAWLGEVYSPEVAAEHVVALRRLREEHGRAGLPFETSILAPFGIDLDAATIDAYAAAGVDRIVATPWARPDEALDRLEKVAGEIQVEERKSQ